MGCCQSPGKAYVMEIRAGSEGLTALEELRRKCLSGLRVSSESIEASRLLPLAGRPSGAVRVLQYNLLASAFGEDGFLVKPVLADWPAGPGNVPTSSKSSVKFHDLIDEILAAQGNNEKLDEVKSKYDVPDSDRNLKAVVDWGARILQIQCFVQASDADVLVFQEVDRYDQLRKCLEDLGYSSCLPGAGEYRPAHLDGFDDWDDSNALLFQKAWASRGYAFRPGLASTCMATCLSSTGLDEKILAAAEAQDAGLKEKVTDPKRGSLHKSWCRLAGGSEKLLRAAGISDLTEIDDMGVAIFWKKDRFDAADLDFPNYPGGGGVVQVRLKDKAAEGKSLLVVGAHLSSGDGLEDEEKRLQKQVDGDQGLKSLVAAACSGKEPLLLCMDANSHPQLVTKSDSSCWRALRSATGASVWDDFFDENGVPKTGGGLDPPVTSNKVRGPLSDQAKKIGKHAYYLIDHIYFNPSSFEMLGHVFAPKRYASSREALQDVQPSLANPSDHFPVLVDLRLR